MAVYVLSGIVRIVSGRHIGTGFVVSADGLILTCVHVLGSYLILSANWMFLRGVCPTRPRGRDKSGPYDIASLVVFGQFANNILSAGKSTGCVFGQR